MLKVLKILPLIVFVCTIISYGQPRYTITKLKNPAPGYLLFDFRDTNNKAGFIDNYGYKIFETSFLQNTFSLKYHPNNKFTYLGGNTYYILDGYFNKIDSIVNPTDYDLDFHEILLLKNGNYMLLCKEYLQIDMSKVVNGGNEEAKIMTNVLVETNTSGQIIWKWRAYDYLKITDVTDRINLKLKNIDLTHINSIDEDSEGNILISVRHYDELIKINKKTGDIIWRFGGSASKKNQFKILNDSINGFVGFSHQHTASFLDNGNILLFDNGNLRNERFSRAVEYKIDEINLVATKVWEYRYSPDIYQRNMCSAYRLPNGNTLINWGSHGITEVTKNNDIAFELIFKGDLVYRAYKILHNTDAVYNQINQKGIYAFSDDKYDTDATIHVDELIGSGNTHIQKHYYPPHISHFADSNFSQIYPYRWVFCGSDIAEISGKIELDLIRLQEVIEPTEVTIYMRPNEGTGLFMPLETTYDPEKRMIVAQFDGWGEFIIASNQVSKPILKYPSKSSTVFTNIALEWLKTSGATAYIVEIDTITKFVNPVLSAISYANKYYVSGLENNTEYFWRVKAFNNKDTSQWSAIFDFLTEMTAPKLLYPLQNQVGIKKTDSLIWSFLKNVDKYQIQLSLTDDFSIVSHDIYHNYNSILIPNDLNPFTQYFWRVRAVILSDTSDWSDIRIFTTQIQSPTAVSPVHGGINLELNPILRWQPQKGTFLYDIELSTDSTFLNILIPYYTLSQSSIQIQTLENDTKYFWRIRAYNTIDTSEWSDIYDFHTLLHSPIITSPQNKQTGFDIDSDIVWTKTNSANQYIVEIAKDSIFTKIPYNLISSENFVKLNSNLDYDSIYFIRIKSFRGNHTSTWSDIVKFLTGLKPIVIKSPNNDEVVSPENLTISWLNENDDCTIQIQISNDIDFINLINNIDNIKGDAIQITLPPLSTYYLRIKCFNERNHSKWSEVASFSTSSLSSIYDNLGSSGIQYSFYPNPFNNYLYIECRIEHPGNYKLIISDLTNNLNITVFDKYFDIGSYIYILDTGSFPTGTYYYLLQSNNKIFNGKLIIIK